MKRLIAILLCLLPFSCAPAWAESNYRLFVLFSTPEKPEPHYLPNWGSRSTKGLDNCLQRRTHLQGYLEENVGFGVKTKAFCVRFDLVGYDEALEEFKRSIGEPS
jgi:hypothetical protein